MVIVDVGDVGVEIVNGSFGEYMFDFVERFEMEMNVVKFCGVEFEDIGGVDEWIGVFFEEFFEIF